MTYYLFKNVKLALLPVVKQTFVKLIMTSGLYISEAKSHIIFGGLNMDIEIEQIRISRFGA